MMSQVVGASFAADVVLLDLERLGGERAWQREHGGSQDNLHAYGNATHC
jgi:hypothetical protein